VYLDTLYPEVPISVACGVDHRAAKRLDGRLPHRFHHCGVKIKLGVRIRMLETGWLGKGACESTGSVTGAPKKANSYAEQSIENSLTSNLPLN